jgi:epoxyqueuosine reductase
MRPNSNSDSSSNLTQNIKQYACNLGFDVCGIAPAIYLDKEDKRIRAWIDSGYAAGMSYLEKNGDKRSDPRLLVDNAKSVIVVLVNYYQDVEFIEDSPQISKYALGKDYHKTVKDKLYLLLEYLKGEVAGASGRVFVDSAPVMERSWAAKAGVGWIGKNSMLINREIGSFTFIGEVITDIELDYNKPTTAGYCGSCTRCLDACPTQAILPDRTIDSNRCISYLTIENQGEIPLWAKGKFENNIFGCDICQDVCPWNSKAKETSIKDFFAKPELLKATKEMWNNISEEEFSKLFNDSSVMRAGYNGIKRNLEFLK